MFFNLTVTHFRPFIEPYLICLFPPVFIMRLSRKSEKCFEKEANSKESHANR